MHLKDAEFVRDDDERERVEGLRRPEPDVPRRTRIEMRLEMRGALLSDDAVGAVGGDDQVGIAESGRGNIVERADFLLEPDVHAKLDRAGLENLEQLAARDAAEAVAAGRDRRALEVDVDV